jgi:hypothetical protein
VRRVYEQGYAKTRRDRLGPLVLSDELGKGESGVPKPDGFDMLGRESWQSTVPFWYCVRKC